MTPPIPPDNKHYLVVVADEYRAILYARDTLIGPLRKLRTFTNKPARMKTGEILADRGGRSFDSHGQGRHMMESEKADPKKQLATAFAKKIADEIAADMHNGRCRGFALVAAPRFLGLLRHEIAGSVKAEPYASVDKDVVDKDEEFIADLLERA